MANMLVTFLSAFYTDVNLVADIFYIAVPYLRGHFLIDCVANLPGFILFEQGDLARTLYPLKLLRILKARHFLRITLEAGRVLFERKTRLMSRTISAILQFIK